MTKLMFTFVFASLIALQGCGHDDDDNDSPGRQQQEENLGNFSTRLDNNLLIAGKKCDGNETTEYGGQTYNCERDEWLVTIDNVNTCTDDGLCTEIGVPAIVAEFDIQEVTAPEYALFKIDPESPVTPAQQASIDKVWVKTELNGDTSVIYR